MSRVTLCIVASVFMLSVAHLASGQEHPALERGFSPEKIYDFSNLDSVDLFSGALAISIPIGDSYPVGGSRSLSLKAVYNSKIYDFEEVLNPYQGGPTYLIRSTPALHQTAGLGWTVTLGKLIPPDDPSNETQSWQYLDSNGGRHTFFATLHRFETPDPGVFYTRDSTYLRLKQITTPNGGWTLEFADGQIHRFTSEGIIERIEDRHGNYIDVAYPEATRWVLTDNHGRTQTVVFESMTSDGASVMVVDKVKLAAFGTTTPAEYDFVYDSTAQISPACTDTFHSLGSTIRVPMLTQIVLPDLSSYDFTYYGPVGGCVSGLVTSMKLPTLGEMAYGYGVWEQSTPGCNDLWEWAQRSPGVTSRSFVDSAGTTLGEWSYNHQLSAPPDPGTGLCTGETEDPPELAWTTVTTPLGDRRVHYFSSWPNFVPASPSPNGYLDDEYALPFDRATTDASGSGFLSIEIWDCEAGNCDLERSVYVRYEYEGPCAAEEPGDSCANSNRRLAWQRTVFEDDLNGSTPFHSEVTQTDPDGLGHYRHTQTDGNFPSGNVRTTFTNYNPGHDQVVIDNVLQPGWEKWPIDKDWILDAFVEKTSTESGVTAKTDFCFVDGLPTTVRTMVGSSPGVNDIIAFYDYNAGNPTRERYYGGDVDSASTVADICNFDPDAPANVAQYDIAHTYQYGTLATSQYAGAAFKSVDRDIDLNTGLVAAERDTAGLQTSYEYDDMNRLVWEKPAAGHDAWTEYIYKRARPTGPAKVKIWQHANGSKTGTVLTQNQIWFDDFGRVSRQWSLMPGEEWSLRETRYNVMGLKSQVSESAYSDIANPTSPTHWTQFLAYDAFDRPTTLRPPDGASHDVSLQYFGNRLTRRTVKVATTKTSETSFSTTELYDRQGRLYRVIEGSGPANGDVETTYTYDVGNRLKQVKTTAEGVTQKRIFAYDLRGFLLSESHPEKDGLVTYSGYDARGNVGRKVDGPSDLTYIYDASERLSRIEESLGSKRKLKQFTYATANSGSDLRRGKLWKASRFQYDISGVSTVPEGYIFADGFESGDVTAWSTVESAGLAAVSARDPIAAAAAGGLFEVEVEEVYTYAGKSGRTSKRVTTARYRDGTTDWLDVASFDQSWMYDDLGATVSTTYPKCTHDGCTDDDGATLARTVNNTYTHGMLTGIPGYASTFSYHPSGLFARFVHSNGVNLYQGADPNGMARPGWISATGDESTLWGTGDYGYDGAGNITSMGSSWFTYDAVSRLVSANLNLDPALPASSPVDVTRTYEYDSFGNLQSLSGTVGRNTPTDKASNRLSTSTTYDAAGNLTHWQGATYTYDPFNQMVRFSSGGQDWLYIYTAGDERLWQVQLGVNPRFDRWMLRDLSGKVLRVYHVESGNLWSLDKDYVYREGQLLAAETSSGVVLHFHTDHLGTPRLITDSDRKQVAYHAYYPYGEEATDPFQDLETMKFTGHERDLNNPDGTGDDLDYMMARHCSPVTGRFLSVDPLDGLQRFPQSWNRFSYARSNPLKYIDPTGMYVFGACTGDEKTCLADQTAFEKARQADLQSKDAAVRAAAAVYGDPGQENGITVAFGTLSQGTAGQMSPTLQGNLDGTVGMTASVVFKQGMRGSGMRGAVGHEGQHILDAQGFIASFAKDPAMEGNLSWDIEKNLTVRQTETNAYRITHSIFWDANEKFKTGCRGCNLGEAAKTAADVSRAINRILTNPEGSYATKLNNRQFSAWITPPQPRH